MALNPLQQVKPQLSVKEISDLYIKKNFDNLSQYFQEENQMLGFKFFDLSFDSAQEDYLLAHGFGFIPQDVIVTKIVGAGSVTFNHGEFTSEFVSLTISGACRVRFFVGQYWKFMTVLSGQATDATSYGGGTSAAGTTTFSNPMTTVGDQIVGAALGAATRVAAGTVGQYWAAQGAATTPVWQSFLPPNLLVLTSGTTYAVSYYFFAPNINATAAATYTHNGATFTVVDTVASSPWVLMTSTAAPLASGTLTKASGTGANQIAFTYRRAPLYIVVHLQGGGGGGGASSNTGAGQSSAGGGGGGGGYCVKRIANPAATYTYAIGTQGTGGGSPGAAGGVGGSTTFNAGAIVAIGGNGGPGAGASGGPVFLSGAGGGGAGYTGADWGVSGGQGSPGITLQSGSQLSQGAGGNSYLGLAQQAGENAGNAAGAAGVQGAGGGGGCNGASAGAQAGGAGGLGIILIWEHWQ